MASCLKLRKIITKEETHFMKNGRILLEELIASCDGKCNPIRTFSAKVLKKATNKYHHAQIIERDIDYILYKGYLEDHPVSVKKYNAQLRTLGFMGSPFFDIVIGSQMSAHSNVLKLIGCCLETEHPILVYEFVGSETLSCYIPSSNEIQPRLLSWKCRIKITADIASALAYLHTALSRPVIHRDIRPANIILDHNRVAKLTDFSLAIRIPDGQSHVEDVVRGKMGYAAPEYVATGGITEKVDVFSFGMFLLEVLTGRKYVYREAGDVLHFLSDRINDLIDNQQIIEIVHPAISREDIEEQQLQAIAKLALSCMSEEAEDRPTMTDVARELKRIQKHILILLI